MDNAGGSHAIQLSCLVEFAQQISPEASIDDVIEQVIKPAIASKKQCYAKILHQAGKTALGAPDYFAVYNANANFRDGLVKGLVMRLLPEYYEASSWQVVDEHGRSVSTGSSDPSTLGPQVLRGSPEDVFIWLDFLALDALSPAPPKAVLDVWKSTIANTKRSCLLLVDNAGLLFTDLRCLHQVAIADTLGVDIQCLFTSNDSQNEAEVAGFVLQTLSLSRAEAQPQELNDAIVKEVAAGKGVHAVEAQVRTAFVTGLGRTADLAHARYLASIADTAKFTEDVMRASSADAPPPSASTQHTVARQVMIPGSQGQELEFTNPADYYTALKAGCRHQLAHNALIASVAAAVAMLVPPGPKIQKLVTVSQSTWAVAAITQLERARPLVLELQERATSAVPVVRLLATAQLRSGDPERALALCGEYLDTPGVSEREQVATWQLQVEALRVLGRQREARAIEKRAKKSRDAWREENDPGLGWRGTVMLTLFGAGGLACVTMLIYGGIWCWRMWDSSNEDKSNDPVHIASMTGVAP